MFAIRVGGEDPLSAPKLQVHSCELSTRARVRYDGLHPHPQPTPWRTYSSCEFCTDSALSLPEPPAVDSLSAGRRVRGPRPLLAPVLEFQFPFFPRVSCGVYQGALLDNERRGDVLCPSAQERARERGGADVRPNLLPQSERSPDAAGPYQLAP